MRPVDADRLVDRISKFEGVVNLPWFKREVESEPTLTAKEIIKLYIDEVLEESEK